MEKTDVLVGRTCIDAAILFPGESHLVLVPSKAARQDIMARILNELFVYLPGMVDDVGQEPGIISLTNGSVIVVRVLESIY